MTALELKKWAEEHCQSSKVDYIMNIVVADRDIVDYYFSWGGFDYELSMQWNGHDVENIFFTKYCDDNKVLEQSLELEDLAIIDGKLFISALPRQYY